MDPRSLLERYEEYAKRKDAVGLFEWLASLSKEDRDALLDLLASYGIDTRKLLVDLAENYVAGTTKSFDEYIEVFRKVFGEDIPEEVLRFTADVVLVRSYNQVLAKRDPSMFEALVKEFDELAKYLDEARRREVADAIARLGLSIVIDSLRRGDATTATRILGTVKGLQSLVAEDTREALGFLDLMVRTRSGRVGKLIDAINAGRYVDAWSLYQSLSDEERKLFEEYLRVNGYDPTKVIEAVRWNAFWSEASRARNLDELARIVEKYYGKSKTIEEARKLERFLNLLRDRRFEEALRMIERERDEELARKLFAALIASIDYDTFVALRSRLEKLAERLGMKDVVEHARLAGSLEDAIAKAVEEAFGGISTNVAEALLSIVRQSLSERNVQRLKDLLKNYGELLDVEVAPGATLRNIVEGAIAYLEIEPLLKDVAPRIEKLAKYLQWVGEALKEGRRLEFPFTVSELDELEQKLVELENRVRSLLPELRKLFTVLKLGDAEKLLRSVEDSLRLVRLAMAVRRAIEGDLSEATRIAEKLDESSKSLVYAIVARKLFERVPSLEEVMCMLRVLGIYPTTAPRARVGRRVMV